MAFSIKRENEVLREQLQQAYEERHGEVKEGETLATIPRHDCVFACEKGCEFVLFNAHTKSPNAFTPSHACPGHPATRVGMCPNFHGWHPKEMPEKNLLNHLFGIRNGQLTESICERIAELELQGEDRVLISFAEDDGEEERAATVIHLSRIANDEYCEKILARVHEMHSPKAPKPSSSSSSTVILPVRDTPISRKRPSATPLIIRMPPPSASAASAPSSKRFRSAEPQTAARQRLSTGSQEECHDEQPASIPADWPFHRQWQDSSREFERAQEALRKVAEMREMLLATLAVFNRHRSV